MGSGSSSHSVDAAHEEDVLNRLSRLEGVMDGLRGSLHTDTKGLATQEHKTRCEIKAALLRQHEEQNKATAPPPAPAVESTPAAPSPQAAVTAATDPPPCAPPPEADADADADDQPRRVKISPPAGGSPSHRIIPSPPPPAEKAEGAARPHKKAAAPVVRTTAFAGDAGSIRSSPSASTSASPGSNAPAKRSPGFVPKSPLRPVPSEATGLQRGMSGRVRVKSVAGIGGDRKVEKAKKPSKKAVDLLRRARAHFADAYAQADVTLEVPPFFKCTPIGCIAVAISQVLSTAHCDADADGAPDAGPPELPPVTDATLVSVGNIFCDLKLPFHYISMAGLTMAEVHDYTVQYLSVGEKTKGARFAVSYMMADSSHSAAEVADEDDEIALFDTQSVTLVEFRKEMAASAANGRVTYIFNYDPYIVQEHFITMVEEDEDDGSDDEDAPVRRRRSVHDRIALLTKYKKRNQGAFAVFQSYNLAESKVVISSFDPITQELTQEAVPLSVLYEACSVKDGYTKRPRGLIKIEMLEEDVDPCPRATVAGAVDEWGAGLLPRVSMLEEGGGRGFLLEQADPSLKPHLVAVGYAIQLFNLRNAVTSGVTIPRWSDRVGVALPDVAYELNLPLEGFVGASGSDAVTDAYVALSSYLRSKACDSVDVDVVYYQRKGNNVDGFPNHLHEDLETEIMQICDERRDTTMILSFDVNATHHVARTGEKMPHFGILAGYDAASQQVVVADVAPKVYKSRWKISLTQLWAAMMGYGYILIAPKDASFEHPLRGEMNKNRAAVAGCGKYRPPLMPDFMTFEYPSKVYCASVIALAMTVLTGWCVQVQHVIKNSGFMPSFLLSDHLSLGDFERVAHLFIMAGGYDHDIVSSCHYLDQTCDTEDAFHELLVEADAEYRSRGGVLVLNISAAALAERSEYWNGGDTGSYVILQAYSADTRNAILMSVARDPSKRCFELPLAVLHQLCGTVDPTSRRVRGYMRLRKTPGSGGDRSRGVALYNHAVGGCISVSHPFKLRISPHMSGLAWAFKALKVEMMPEMIYYAWHTESSLAALAHFRMLDYPHAVDICAKRYNLAVACERLLFASCEGFIQKVRDATAANNTHVLVTAQAGVALGIDDANTTCGLIVGYDSESVTVQDSNPTRHGRTWVTTWELLHEAMAVDTDYYGIISVRGV